MVADFFLSSPFQARYRMKRKEILEKFWDIEDRGKIRIPLIFKNPTQLFESNLSIPSQKLPFINHEVFEELNRMLEHFSYKTKIALSFAFTDKQNYTDAALLDILQSNFEFQKQLLKKNIVKVSAVSMGLAIAGSLLLLVSYFLNSRNVSQLFFDFVNISGTFMVWDAVSRFVIDRIAKYRSIKKYDNIQIEIGK